MSFRLSRRTLLSGAKAYLSRIIKLIRHLHIYETFHLTQNKQFESPQIIPKYKSNFLHNFSRLLLLKEIVVRHVSRLKVFFCP